MLSDVPHPRIFPRLVALAAMAALFPAVLPGQETNVEYETRKALQAAGLSSSSTSSSSSSSASFGGPSDSPPPYLITFFPASPPIYGGTLPEVRNHTAVFNGKRLDAPDDLADFVGEIFYPALGTRMFEGKLARKITTRLDAYRANRTALLDELIGELLSVQSADKATRAQALQAFAPKQAARLAALEKEAEQLRRDLVDGGMFGRRADWNEVRPWLLDASGGLTSRPQPEPEFQVARATAFFQEGFSIEQRGLLRELAMDRARAARVSRGQRSAPDDDPAAMFFSPETARFHAPSPLPPELFRQVARYNGEKAALKRELLETLIACEGLPPRKRVDRFSTLAFEHEKRLAALENDAEEIRRALDALPDTPPPWLPPISPELRDRIDTYNRDRNALMAEYMAARLRAGLDGVQLEDRAQRTQRLAAAARDAGRQFETDHAERIDALLVRYNRIRDDLVETARGLNDPRTNKPLTMESLLDAHRVANQRFDTIGREEAMYQRYKIAMLQPGLSPAQRRLLFRAAHAALAQALPMGEFLISTARNIIPRS